MHLCPERKALRHETYQEQSPLPFLLGVLGIELGALHFLRHAFTPSPSSTLFSGSQKEMFSFTLWMLLYLNTIPELLYVSFCESKTKTLSQRWGNSEQQQIQSPDNLHLEFANSTITELLEEVVIPGLFTHPRVTLSGTCIPPNGNYTYILGMSDIFMPSVKHP